MKKNKKRWDIRQRGGLLDRATRIRLKLETFINKKFNDLPTKTKDILVLSFLGLASGVCIFILIDTFSHNHNYVFPKEEQIPLPLELDHIECYQDTVQFDELEDILWMEWILDSLEDKPVYDSLKNARPGLVDSVNSLIKTINH